MTKELPVLAFKSPTAFRSWLEKNHAKSDGLWIRMFRKDSGRKSVTHGEALDEALCYGWIDGQGRSHDEESWLQKFTPRRKRSTWSKRNREHVARLIEEKRMTPAGMKEVEAAQQDGRWDRAYDSPKDMQVPADFIRELQKNPAAYAFFQTLNKANTFTIAFRLQTAKKPETRERRMKVLLEMMVQGRKLH